MYIKNERKHVERMCIRATDMAMDPQRNKYVRNIRGIRIIQDYLVRSADKAIIPKVANGNVDVSLSTIHATVLATLRRYARPAVVSTPTHRGGSCVSHFVTVICRSAGKQVSL